MRVALLVAGCCLVSHPVVAQSPGPMITDRPDQTESAAIVGAGLFQLEFGGLFTTDRDPAGNTESLVLAPALARIGVTRRIEARVGFAGWTRIETSSGATSTAASGVGGVDLGFKALLREGDGMSPTIAFIGTATLPVGTAGFRSERVDPSARVAVSHALSDRVGLGYNVGVNAFAVAGPSGTTTEAEGIYTAVLGFALADRVGAFVEGFGSLGLSDAVPSAHLIDAGFTFLARDNLQLDVSGGVRYAGTADDWFVSGGASVRLPR